MCTSHMYVGTDSRSEDDYSTIDYHAYGWDGQEGMHYEKCACHQRGFMQERAPQLAQLTPIHYYRRLYPEASQI